MRFASASRNGDPNHLLVKTGPMSPNGTINCQFYMKKIHFLPISL